MADKNHLHHRLMRLGHGQTRSVLILWTWTALLSALVLYPSFFHGGLSIVPFGIAALAIALYTGFGVRGRGDHSPRLAGGPVSTAAQSRPAQSRPAQSRRGQSPRALVQTGPVPTVPGSPRPTTGGS